MSEHEIQANSSASEKVCDHPSTEKAASEAELVCAEAYQVVGTLLSDIGQFDTERGQKILDNLSEARMIHTDILPWPSIERAAPPAGQVIAHPANSLRSLPESSEPSLLGRETVREAQSIIRALAEQAKEKCDGCRLSWKLKDWRHREPLPITCEAKIERQAIRALASLSPLKE